MASSTATTRIATKSTVLQTYRTLARLIQRLPENQKLSSLTELRSSFRSNAELSDKEKVKDLIREAGEKIAYLRIITPKASNSTNTSSGGSSKRWIYTKEGVHEIRSGSQNEKQD